MEISRSRQTFSRVATETAVLPAVSGLKDSKLIVLRSALELFAHRGFAGTSIRDIAELAGMKSASLYSHYKSKEQILAALIKIGHEELLRRLRQAVMASPPDPVQRLRAIIRAHVRLHTEFSMLAVVVNHELHALSGDYVSGALALRNQAAELLIDIIVQGQKEGVFRLSHDPLLAASAIGAMGLRVAEWYSSDHRLSVSEIEEAYADFGCQIVGAEVPGGRFSPDRSYQSSSSTRVISGSPKVQTFWSGSETYE